jgi:hypothetical protein
VHCDSNSTDTWVRLFDEGIDALPKEALKVAVEKELLAPAGRTGESKGS